MRNLRLLIGLLLVLYSVASCSGGQSTGSSLPRPGELHDFKDRPDNQPVNRFSGYQDVPTRPADPLPPWLGSPFRKLGIIIEPDHNDARLTRVYNPTAIVVRDDASGKDKVVMFFRAEDGTGAGVYDGTSRIFRAESLDGRHFSEPELVLEPTESYEIEPHPGGCEDPRVVLIEDGRYLMTYTAFDGKTARLALATSNDLKTWEKQGILFPDIAIRSERKGWSKSGAIVPQKIRGEYIMYFGDQDIYMARSKDAIHWTYDPEPVVIRRRQYFDAILAEPGPTPFVDGEGIHLIYNGDSPPHGYAVGEVVFDLNDPLKIIRRSNGPFLKPTEEWEITGHVGNVIFAEGLAWLGDQIFLYYGAADGKIACAVAKAGE